jgi:hypothetical protein
MAYALCYIQSEADQAGLLMRVGSDDQAKIFLNEKEIYRFTDYGGGTHSRTYAPDQDVVACVELRAGLNVLVFKVANETGAWQGSVRFTDAAGQPLKGIRITLDPEDKDLR